MIQLTNTDWRDIIFRIKRGESVMVIGPGAVYNESGKPLQDVFVEMLETELSSPVKRKDKLFYLAEQLKKQKAGESILIENAEKAYKPTFVSETLKKISLLPFKIIISATPDTMLQRAFEANGLSFSRTYYNYNTAPSRIEKPSKEIPLIYQLFGSIDTDDSLILTHDHLFDFLFAIVGAKPLPIEFRDELRQSHNFIFLGFDFEEWYLKILLRLFEIHADKSSYAYATCEPDADTVSFYSDEFKLDFIQGKIPEFIDELYERCRNEGLLREKKGAVSLGEKLRKMVANNEIAEVIDFLDEFLNSKDEDELLNQVFILSGRYNRVLGKLKKGLVTDENASVEFNQINEAILDVINEADKL